MREMGQWVRSRRVERGLSQLQVAQSIGVDRSYVSRIERGLQYQQVSYGILRNLGALLGAVPGELEALLYDRPLPRTLVGAPLMPIAIGVVAQANAGLGGGPVEEWVYLPWEVARGRTLLGVRVSGDCMEPDVADGDVVIIDVAAVASEGSMVAATILASGDFVLKRLYRRNGEIELRPNVGEPLVLRPDQVRIDGVAIQVNRRLERGR